MNLRMDFHQAYSDTLFGGEKEYFDFHGIDLTFMVTQVLKM